MISREQVNSNTTGPFTQPMGSESLPTFAKSSLLNFRLGFECASGFLIQSEYLEMFEQAWLAQILKAFHQHEMTEKTKIIVFPTPPSPRRSPQGIHLPQTKQLPKLPHLIPWHNIIWSLNCNFFEILNQN